MGELSSTSPGPRLDLDNLYSAEAQQSRYVLTSPRSLQSCARLGIKPVKLLIKSLNQLIAEQQEAPLEAVRVMHESYEKERKKLLQMCRDERERIIQAGGDRLPGRGGGKTSGMETKLKDLSLPYADLCCTGKSVKSSCSAASNRSTGCSYSLGDLYPTQATEMKLQKLTQDIKKEMCVNVSERDCKIAALMLVKHQEEQASLQLSLREEKERQEAGRKAVAQRAQAEILRRRRLRQSMRRWQEELEARRKLKVQQEKEKVGHVEQEILLREDRWRRLKAEVEAQRRDKMEAAQTEAGGRKQCQEKQLREKEEVERRRRERERQVAEEKEQRARRSKVTQERKRRKRLEEGNQRELLRHLLLKQQVEQQVEEDEEHMRSAFEKKMQHSSEKRAQAVEARLRELQERGAEEEEHIQRARLRAELQSLQQLTHRQILVQLSQRRAEKAALHASARRQSRARHTREHNQRRRLLHQRMRERVQQEEEATRKVRESCLLMKELRRERLCRQREQIQEEANRLARASFHMRERVRQQTQHQTFHQMDLEAQLAASISRMKLNNY